MDTRLGLRLAVSLSSLLLASGSLLAQANLSVLLPERTRLLEDQRVDLVIEIRNAATPSGLRVTAGSRDITSAFRGPTAVDLDCDGRPDSVYRADAVGFTELGTVRLTVSAQTAAGSLQDVRDIIVYPFTPAQRRRNVVLFIGDAMGTAYRDAARLVGRSVESVPGVTGFREGFFDSLQEMDKMPISGMVMTYGNDRIIPDSANTATAWSTGNKSYTNALGVFADGTDCRWRLAGINAATAATIHDNPKVETLWEYLKRRFNYRTGVVTTAYVTDATPGGEGSHVATRVSRFEVARQYFENPFLSGTPVYDVLMGGGREEFDADIRADGRDLVREFQNAGYGLVNNATELRAVSAGSTSKLLGMFRRANGARRDATNLRSQPDGNMDVAYDKLGLTRPGSEPLPSFGPWTDQPFLDLMTQKAIEVLSGPNGDQPFILMVEAASIDKQSHPNHAAGQIWDTIELDKSIGVARSWARRRSNPDTLVVVTADHDQSMSIIGTAPITDQDLTDRAPTYTMSFNAGNGEQTARVYRDANTNVRAAYNYSNAGGDPNTSGRNGPPTARYADVYNNDFPNYMDTNGDGYPENRQANGKGDIRLTVGYRTGDHTASSVPVTAEGPGAFLFTGYMDQTDIMFKMAVSLRGDTEEGDRLVNLLSNPRYPQTIGK